MTLVPTMFKVASGLRIVAFNYFNVVDEQILSVYFYDVVGQREFARALGAQGLICHQAAADESDGLDVVFLRDPIFGSEPIEKADQINKKRDLCIEQSQILYGNNAPYLFRCQVNFDELSKSEDVVQIF